FDKESDRLFEVGSRFMILGVVVDLLVFKIQPRFCIYCAGIVFGGPSSRVEDHQPPSRQMRRNRRLVLLEIVCKLLSTVSRARRTISADDPPFGLTSRLPEPFDLDQRYALRKHPRHLDVDRMTDLDIL